LWNVTRNLLQTTSLTFLSVFNSSDLKSTLVLLVSDGGATRPLPRDGGVEILHGDATVGPKPQGKDQRSKIEVVPKMARQRGYDAGQSERR